MPPREAPVLDDPGLGQRSAGGDRLLRERPQPLVLARDRGVEDRPSGSPAPAGRRAAGIPAGRRSRGRRGSRGGRASPSPASSSTSRPRSCPRSGASRAGRARGSRPGSRPRGADASRRRRRTTAGRRARIWATKSGQSSTGSRHASCAQYSNTRPCASSRGTVPRVIGADARRERDPVAALDRRDRVELHAREPPDRRLDLALSCRCASVSRSPGPRSRSGAARGGRRFASVAFSRTRAGVQVVGQCRTASPAMPSCRAVLRAGA